MVDKVTLQVEDVVNDGIVKIVLRPTSHVDNKFFSEVMEEDNENMDFKNYPVKITAIRMSWILSQHGEAYLMAIIDSENLELFNNEAN